MEAEAVESHDHTESNSNEKDVPAEESNTTEVIADKDENSTKDQLGISFAYKIFLFLC